MFSALPNTNFDFSVTFFKILSSANAFNFGCSITWMSGKELEMSKNSLHEVSMLMLFSKHSDESMYIILFSI